jgi:hypothetical protein
MIAGVMNLVRISASVRAFYSLSQFRIYGRALAADQHIGPIPSHIDRTLSQLLGKYHQLLRVEVMHLDRVLLPVLSDCR